MRRISAAAVFCILAAAFSSAAGTIPDWVRQAARQTLPAYAPDTNAVVLLKEESTAVRGPGEYIEHHRRVVRILRREGVREATFGVSFQRDEKILSLHAWSLDSAGHEYEVKDKEFTEGNHYSYELYSDRKYRKAEVPAAQPGSVVAFEYEVRRHEWLNQFVWIFHEDIPVVQASFTVQLPPGWEYKNAWANFTPIEPVSLGDNRWQWTVHNVARIEDESRMPHPVSLCAKMWLGYFGSGQPTGVNWKSIGAWNHELTVGRRNLTPEIADRVHQLIAGKPDFSSRLEALTRFLQSEVRYVAIEIGIGGFQPHFASDIFRYRYGDCKDKVTLLSTMLQEAGIRSEYVLISTERGLIEPSVFVDWFNHAIIAIELPPTFDASAYDAVFKSADGHSYLLFDPTDEYTPVGQIRGDLQDSHALLVTDAGGELIHTPRQKPESNQLTRQGHFSLSADGTLTGDIIEDRTGDNARQERAYFAHHTEKQRREGVEHRLNASLQGFTLANLDIDHETDLQKILRLTLKLNVPQYAQARGPLLLLRPRIIGEKSFALDTKPRHYDLVFNAASSETDAYDIELPSGYKVDDLPDGANADFGFASYQSKYEVEGSHLRYSRKYVVKDLTVPVDKFDKLRSLESLISADEHARVILKQLE